MGDWVAEWLRGLKELMLLYSFPAILCLFVALILYGMVQADYKWEQRRQRELFTVECISPDGTREKYKSLKRFHVSGEPGTYMIGDTSTWITDHDGREYRYARTPCKVTKEKEGK